MLVARVVGPCHLLGFGAARTVGGVAFADFLHGVPIVSGASWAGNFFDLVKPYALLGGLTTLSLFTLHGRDVLGLKADGEVRERAATRD